MTSNMQKILDLQLSEQGEILVQYGISRVQRHVTGVQHHASCIVYSSEVMVARVRQKVLPLTFTYI